jgi:cysteine desulfurase/selenocysteine lyase
MSTPDITAAAQGPAPLAATPLSATTATPTAAAPSPGIGRAGTRVPAAPSVPDPEPTSLATLISRLANEMFAAPPVGDADLDFAGEPTLTHARPSASPAATMPATVPTDAAQGAPAPTSTVPTVPVQGAPVAAPTSPVATTPATASASPTAPPAPQGRAPADANLSPFSLPLQLDAVMDVHAADPWTLVLPHATLALLDPTRAAPEPDRDATPYWLATEPAGAPPVRTVSPAVSHEHEPLATPTPRARPGAFDPELLRREFPILQERVHGKRLVWLDNAATTQKPRAVIDRLVRFYERENSNVHRAAHTLAARATDAYEGARATVRRFLNAPSTREIVFVRGATEGINLVAQSWGRRHVEAGDEVVITWLEHHANIVPWQMLCAERGARLRVAPVDERGQIILEAYEKLLGPRTRIVSLPQVSNALGTVTPARAMVELAHRHGARVLVDGAQAVSHMAVDVQQLDCDFYVFSGHKVFAPTGIGVVFGKQELLDAMPPWQGGGNMIQDVTHERSLYQPPPARFEAGTGNIADAVGLGAALEWLLELGLENVERHEHDLLAYATDRLATVPGLTMIGTAPGKAGVLSFVLAGQKTEEVGGLLDQEGIAVRSGHHCAQPILRRYGLEATVRASLAPYNTCEDIDLLVAALRRLQAGQPARPVG